jgi:hypothetical protein
MASRLSRGIFPDQDRSPTDYDSEDDYELSEEASSHIQNVGYGIALLPDHVKVLFSGNLYGYSFADGQWGR